MSLVSFVPTYASFSKKSWFVKTGDPFVKRVVLSAPHSVYTTFGGDAVTGKADIEYVLDVSLKKPDSPLPFLTIDKSAAPIGYQSSEELRSLIESLKIRQSFAVASVGDSSFDLRSLAYVCGAAVASTSCFEDFYYGPPVVSVSTISPTWKVPTVTNLTIAAGLANTSGEFATLARFAALAGCKSVTLMSDIIPPRSHTALQGPDLGVFALKVFANIINAAQSCSCAGAHTEAFFSGMTSIITLNSHTDEGGFLREAVRECEYPRAVGVLTVGVASYFGLSPILDLGSSYLPQVGIGLFLEFVGTLVTSDPGGKETTLLVRDTTGSKPSCFPGLRPAFYSLMAKFRSQVCEDYNLHPSVVGDDSSHNPFFTADLENRHLDYPVIQPFYWVEPGPLTVKERNYQNVCIQGARVDLPLFSGSVVQESAGYVEVHGRVPVGNAMYLKTDEARPRSEGFQYMLSQRYRDENGLSLMEVIADNRLGTTTTQAVFVEPNITNVAQRRWITPHNPVASPAEGITSYPQSMVFYYRGTYAEPTLQDWKTGKVSSFTGPIQVKSRQTGDTEHRSCRHISESNLRWLSNRGKYAPKHVLDLSALPSGFSLPPLSQPTMIAPAIEPVNEADGGEVEYDSDDELPENPNINRGYHGNEPIGTSAPEPVTGPDTQVEADPQTGRRIRVPDAELETEDAMGGESR
jgi:hypothetical protein